MTHETNTTTGTKNGARPKQRCHISDVCQGLTPKSSTGVAGRVCLRMAVRVTV